MLDKIKQLIDVLHEKKNLVLRFREPAACVFCSPQDALQRYHAAYKKSNRFVVEEPKKIKNLVILEEKDIISGKCPECGAERVKERFQLEKLYWTTCSKCRTKQLSTVEGKCPLCDEDAKKAKAKFIKEHGG